MSAMLVARAVRSRTLARLRHKLTARRATTSEPRPTPILRVRSRRCAARCPVCHEERASLNRRRDTSCLTRRAGRTSLPCACRKQSAATRCLRSPLATINSRATFGVGCSRRTPKAALRHLPTSRRIAAPCAKTDAFSSAGPRGRAAAKTLQAQQSAERREASASRLSPTSSSRCACHASSHAWSPAKQRACLPIASAPWRMATSTCRASECERMTRHAPRNAEVVERARTIALEDSRAAAKSKAPKPRRS